MKSRQIFNAWFLRAGVEIAAAFIFTCIASGERKRERSSSLNPVFKFGLHSYQFLKMLRVIGSKF